MKRLFLFSAMMMLGAVIAFQAFADTCPDIASLKAKKLSLDWYEAEPSVLNAETFEQVRIDQNDVTCQYSSYFDKDIRVVLKGKMFPLGSDHWFKRKGESGLFCDEGIAECDFQKYDPHQLNLQIDAIRQRQAEASGTDDDAGDETKQESQPSADTSSTQDEASAKKSESKYGVVIY